LNNTDRSHSSPSTFYPHGGDPIKLFEVIGSTLKQYDEEEEGPDQHKIFGMLRNTAIKKIMTPKSQEEKVLGIIVRPSLPLP
jgi:hypothetical protein